MGTLRPVKPEQPNYSDCGIYLLHYVEKIFGSVAQFYWPCTLNSLDSDWFPLEEVARKRDDLARLIRDLSKEQREQAGLAELVWPDISFLDLAPPPRKAETRKEAASDEYRPDGEEAEKELLETAPGSAASSYGAQAATSSQSVAGRRDPPRLDIRGPGEEVVLAGAHFLDPEPEVLRTADTGMPGGVVVAKPKRRLLTPREFARKLREEQRLNKSLT